jgi:hypothetical protein
MFCAKCKLLTVFNRFALVDLFDLLHKSLLYPEVQETKQTRTLENMDNQLEYVMDPLSDAKRIGMEDVEQQQTQNDIGEALLANTNGIVPQLQYVIYYFMS